MKYIYNFCMLILVLFVTGCYDDRGNYDYKEINEFSIVNFNGSTSDYYTCTLEDEVKLVPEFEFKRFEETDLSYEWFSDDSLISTAKELVFPAKELKKIKEKQSRSYVKLKATSNISGIIQLKGINVDVTPPYFNGFVVLTRQASGEYNLNYLRNYWNGEELTEVKTQQNVYSRQNPGETLGKDVVRLRTHFCYDYSYSDNVLVVKSDAPYNLDIMGGFLTKNVHTSSYFVNNKLPDNFDPVDEFTLCNYSYILNKNGMLYSRKKNNNKDFQSGVYMNEPNKLHSPTTLPQDMEITGVYLSAFSPNAFAFIYDNKYQRLLVAADDGRILYPFPLTPVKDAPEGFPLLHDLKGNVLYMGRTSAKRDTDWVIVFKDASGVKLLKLFVGLQIYNGNISLAKLENARVYSLENSVLHPNSMFEQPNRGGDVLFFTGGTDNNILYCYDFTTGKANEYVVFEHTINTILCEEYYNTEARSAENRTIAVGLASGEVKMVDIRYEAQHETNKDKRVLHGIPLNNGVIADIVYKVGFPYYAQ